MEKAVGNFIFLGAFFIAIHGFTHCFTYCEISNGENYVSSLRNRLALPRGSAISYVTRHASIGRLGDRMKLCSTAYTLAMLCGVDFFYNPFGNFDVFAVHTDHSWSMGQAVYAVQQRKNIQALVPRYACGADHVKGQELLWADEQPTLYQMPGLNWEIFAELNNIPELKGIATLSHFLMPYPAIKRELMRMFAPTIKLKEWVKPHNGISVAVHVRKGSGPDRPLFFNQCYNNYTVLYHEYVFNKSDEYVGERMWERVYGQPLKTSELNCNWQWSDGKFPLKFPPEQYYIDQIVLLSELVLDPVLYIHIFSDSSDIESLTHSLEYAVKERVENKERLIFRCRPASSDKIEDILSDLYGMAKADCLIRPTSNLSEMAQILGDHIIAIAPIDAQVQGGNLVVDKVRITRRLPVGPVQSLPAEPKIEFELEECT